MSQKHQIPFRRQNKISCRKPPNFITTLEGSMGAHRACTFFTSARTGESRAVPEPFPRPALTKFLGSERLSAQSGSSVRSVPCPRQISLQARMAPPTLALLIPANPAQQRPILFNSAVGLGSPRNCHCAGLLSATVFWNARSPLFRSFKKGPARPRARQPVKPADCSAPFDLF